MHGQDLIQPKQVSIPINKENMARVSRYLKMQSTTEFPKTTMHMSAARKMKKMRRKNTNQRRALKNQVLRLRTHGPQHMQETKETL